LCNAVAPIFLIIMSKELQLVLFGLDDFEKGNLKRQYPELADIEEFKDLHHKEVKFCWLVGNRTSPIFKMERSARIKRALEIVWGKGYRKNPRISELVNAETEADIPEAILKGILKMNSFNPEYRLKARLINEYIFETLNELVVLTPQQMATMDIDDRKKYADLATKVGSELQSMLKNLESSYGAKLYDKKTKKEATIGINDVMK
jgi:hypothetical protein